MTRPAAIILLVLALLTFATAGESDPFARAPSTPESEGMDPDLLTSMMELVRAQNARDDSVDTIDSVIVICHGNVVLEEYPNPAYGADRLHPLFSVTKSITSILLGIALDLGLIGSVEDPILEYFPDAVDPEEAPSKSGITVEHLLTMTAGLAWDEDTLPATHPANSFNQLERSHDPIGLVLGAPIISQPGELLWYNSGLSHVLSALIARVSGIATSQFAQARLFEPLGIDSYFWSQDRTGISKGGTQLQLRPRDLARIGALCLGDGLWNGKRIVSELWLHTSTATRIHGRSDYFSGRGYAYHWWTVDEYGVYYASGSQGQSLYVFPQLDLIVVLTGTITEGAILPEQLVRDYILLALTASGQSP